jgi:hypothetical protein
MSVNSRRIANCGGVDYGAYMVKSLAGERLVHFLTCLIDQSLLVTL